MATAERKVPARPQTLSQSAATSWLRLGGRRQSSSRVKGPCGLRGWQPCPSQDTELNEPVRSESSPISQRIGMFEKLSRRHNDENVVAANARIPPCNTAKISGFKDRLLSSTHPALPLSHGNEQVPLPAEPQCRGASAFPPTMDKQGLRQRAAAVRERLSSISSSGSSSNTIQKGRLAQKNCLLSQYSGSQDCIALLSAESIESFTCEPAQARMTPGNSALHCTLRKNPPPEGHIRLGSATWFQRCLSRSDSPTVASVQCVLEQPQPVRGSEVRRLASMCKDKVSGRLFRGSE